MTGVVIVRVCVWLPGSVNSEGRNVVRGWLLFLPLLKLCSYPKFVAETLKKNVFHEWNPPLRGHIFHEMDSGLEVHFLSLPPVLVVNWLCLPALRLTDPQSCAQSLAG